MENDSTAFGALKFDLDKLTNNLEKSCTGNSGLALSERVTELIEPCNQRSLTFLCGPRLFCSAAKPRKDTGHKRRATAVHLGVKSGRENENASRNQNPDGQDNPL